MRGVGVRHAVAAEHGLRFRHFAAAGGKAGIRRIGAALLTDVVQALRLDGEPEQLVLIRYTLNKTG